MSSFLVDSVNENDGSPGDDAPLVVHNYVIHGMSRLLLARREKQSRLKVHRVCTCGANLRTCLTREDVRAHYTLLVLAAQITSNATVPRSFLAYAQARVNETAAMEKDGSKEGASGGGGKVMMIGSTSLDWIETSLDVRRKGEESSGSSGRFVIGGRGMQRRTGEKDAVYTHDVRSVCKMGHFGSLVSADRRGEYLDRVRVGGEREAEKDGGGRDGSYGRRGRRSRKGVEVESVRDGEEDGEEEQVELDVRGRARSVTKMERQHRKPTARNTTASATMTTAAGLWMEALQEKTLAQQIVDEMY